MNIRSEEGNLHKSLAKDNLFSLSCYFMCGYRNVVE